MTSKTKGAADASEEHEASIVSSRKARFGKESAGKLKNTKMGAMAAARKAGKITRS